MRIGGQNFGLVLVKNYQSEPESESESEVDSVSSLVFFKGYLELGTVPIRMIE